MTFEAEQQSGDTGVDPSRIALGARAWVHRDALRWSFARSGGPGGQNVNKLNTKAELRVALSDLRDMDDEALARLRDKAGSRLTRDDDLLFVCEEHRSQRSNREGALARLVELVSAAMVRPKVRKKRKPTRGMIERRLEGKRQKAKRKSDRRWRPTD